MTKSFIQNFFQKKQHNKLYKKVAIISIVAILVCGVILKFTNIFILNYAVNHVKEEFEKNPSHSVSYKTKFDFIGAKLIIKDLNIKVNTGEVDAEEIKISKVKGLLFPSEINIMTKNVSSTGADGRKYITEANGAQEGFFIRLNRKLFKMPTFGGMYFKNPVKYTIKENGKNIGEIKFDKVNFVQGEYENKTIYKGSMVFHDGDLVPYVFLLDVPFNWDIKVKEKHYDEKWGLDNENTETITETDIEKAIFDLDFSKIDIKGKMKYSSQIITSDLDVNIENEHKLADNIFNMVLKTNNDNLGVYKKLHGFVTKNLLPNLKKKNKASTKTTMAVKISKTEDMPEVALNGVMISDVANSIVKTLQ